MSLLRLLRACSLVVVVVVGHRVVLKRATDTKRTTFLPSPFRVCLQPAPPPPRTSQSPAPIMPRSRSTTAALAASGTRRTRGATNTTTLVLSFVLLLCPCLFLLTAAASASSSPSLDASSSTGSSNTPYCTAGAPLAPAVAGWFQSSASRKHHKEEKKRQQQLLQQQPEQQQQLGDEQGAGAVTVAIIRSGKERGLGVARLFASTLRASLTPLLQGVFVQLQILFSVVAQAVERWLVKAPGAAVGRVGKGFGQVRTRGEREGGREGWEGRSGYATTRTSLPDDGGETKRRE